MKNLVKPPTEQPHSQANPIDALPAREMLLEIVQGQASAIATLEGALEPIAQAARVMADTLKANGRLIYAAAGSSALMAMADALELRGTYGISPDRFLLLMAGGIPVAGTMHGYPEDDEKAAVRESSEIRDTDALIAVTASGTTPYTVTCAREARARQAKTICIANNPGAELFAHADISICLPTPPEVVAGSTRMGAATAQKAALNMMSTLMAVELGHIHDGMMVNLVADNAKLTRRAAAIVASIAKCSPQQARKCLQQAQGEVKPAVLLALGAQSLQEARDALSSAGGSLRRAM